MPRHLYDEEKLLIASMVRGHSIENIVLAGIDGALVEDMNDGGMRSIKFCQDGETIFGRQVAEATFIDSDSVPVSLAINLDQNDRLFELDIWKADNSTLRHFPRPDQITIIRRASIQTR